MDFLDFLGLTLVCIFILFFLCFLFFCFSCFFNPSTHIHIYTPGFGGLPVASLRNDYVNSAIYHTNQSSYNTTIISYYHHIILWSYHHTIDSSYNTIIAWMNSAVDVCVNDINLMILTLAALQLVLSWVKHLGWWQRKGENVQFDVRGTFHSQTWHVPCRASNGQIIIYDKIDPVSNETFRFGSIGLDRARVRIGRIDCIAGLRIAAIGILQGIAIQWI